MLKSASSNAYASSSKAVFVGTGSSSLAPLELNSPSFLPPRPVSRRRYSSSASTEPSSSTEPPSEYVLKKLAREARRQPLARKSILPPSLQNTCLPSSILLQHPIVTPSTLSPASPSSPYPLVTFFPPISKPQEADDPSSSEPISSKSTPPPSSSKAHSSMTVAELDKHYRWSDEVVINTAKKYAKRVMKGDPNTPVATLRRRLLAQKLKELAAKEKAAPTKAAMNVQAGEATWKQWMGLRGVPVISKWPTTTHPVKATGIWGVKQISELEKGEKIPPSSTWVGAAKVLSSQWRTIRSSSPLYIQFIRRLPSLASPRTIQGPILPPTSTQLPYLPPAFLPPTLPNLPPIYSIAIYPPHPTSTSTPARTTAFLTNRDRDPTFLRRKIEVSSSYCSELLRLASDPTVTDETRAQVEKYMMLKMRKAGLVSWEGTEGTEEGVVGKLNWRRGKRERVVVEVDFVIGKKITHPGAPRRKKALRKMREALRMVLMDEHAKGDKSRLNWRGYTYVIRPTGQVTQVPMDVLTEFVRESLMRVCRKTNGGGSQQQQQRPSFLQQQQQPRGGINSRHAPQQLQPRQQQQPSRQGNAFGMGNGGGGSPGQSRGGPSRRS